MFEAIIGLECHVQLDTRSKMFCGCPVGDDGLPNRRVCPVCLGLPGALPVVNEAAVHLGVVAATALGCTVAGRSGFDRKHYVYPDLAKGYQITQEAAPLATGGRLHAEVDGRRVVVEVERLHLEEDAGRSTHRGDEVHVDFDRAGVPLAEIVLAPTLHTPAEAEAVLRMLHRVLVEAGVTRGLLEKAHLRCDANVSLHRPGEPLGRRVEVKNLNSFRFVARALAAEIERQRALLEAGEPVPPETRGWQRDHTVRLRSKEGGADYRYLPEPDLGVLVVDATRRRAARAALPGVPLDLWLLARDAERVDRLVGRYGLPRGRARSLAGRPRVAAFFEAAVAAGGAVDAVADQVFGVVLRRENRGERVEESGLTPEALVAVEEAVVTGRLSRAAAREAIEQLWSDGDPVEAVLARVAGGVVDDEAALRELVRAIVETSPDEVARYRSGNTRVLGYFMGEVMRSTRGKADPALARRLVVEALHRI